MNKITNLQDAYTFTLAMLKVLQLNGIKVIQKPSNSKKYDKKKPEDMLPPENWIHVSIIVNKEQSTLLSQIYNIISEVGIGFDTGCCLYQNEKQLLRRDWELDWSFSCNNNNDDSFQDFYIIDELSDLKEDPENMQNSTVYMDGSIDRPKTLVYDDNYSGELVRVGFYYMYNGKEKRWFRYADIAKTQSGQYKVYSDYLVDAEFQLQLVFPAIEFAKKYIENEFKNFIRE